MLSTAISLASDLRSGAVILTGKQRVAAQAATGVCFSFNNLITTSRLPLTREEQVTLDDDRVPADLLREQIRAFSQPRRHLQACRYCGGRDFGQATIPAAIQAAQPRPYKKEGANHAS